MGYLFACRTAEVCEYHKGKYDICPFCFGNEGHVCIPCDEANFIGQALNVHKERGYGVLRGDLGEAAALGLKAGLRQNDGIAPEAEAVKASSDDANKKISELFGQLDLSKASVELGKECKEAVEGQYGPSHRIDVLTVGSVSLRIKVDGANYADFGPGWPKVNIVQVGNDKCNASIEWAKYRDALTVIAAANTQKALESMQNITEHD